MPIYKHGGDVPIKGHSHFLNCCGATYSVLKTKARFNGYLPKGIRVIDGIHGAEGVDKYGVEISHVKTRNGDITVAVQKTVENENYRGW
jgi:hypothetical protein